MGYLLWWSQNWDHCSGSLPFVKKFCQEPVETPWSLNAQNIKGGIVEAYLNLLLVMTKYVQFSTFYQN